MSTAARDWFAANEEKSWSDGVSVTIKPSVWSSGEEYALYIDDGGRDGNPHAWRVQMKHKTLKPIMFALTQIECHQDLRSEETIVELDVVTPAQKARCVESTKHYRAVFANRSEAAAFATTLNKMRKFIDQWIVADDQEALLVAQRRAALDPAVIAAENAAFRRADTDGDGTVTRDEFNAFFEAEQELASAKQLAAKAKAKAAATSGGGYMSQLSHSLHHSTGAADATAAENVSAGGAAGPLPPFASASAAAAAAAAIAAAGATGKKKAKKKDCVAQADTLCCCCFNILLLGLFFSSLATGMITFNSSFDALHPLSPEAAAPTVSTSAPAFQREKATAQAAARKVPSGGTCDASGLSKLTRQNAELTLTLASRDETIRALKRQLVGNAASAPTTSAPAAAPTAESQGTTTATATITTSARIAALEAQLREKDGEMHQLRVDTSRFQNVSVLSLLSFSGILYTAVAFVILGAMSALVIFAWAGSPMLVVGILVFYSALFTILGLVLSNAGNAPLTAGYLHAIATLLTPLLAFNIVRALPNLFPFDKRLTETKEVLDNWVSGDSVFTSKGIFSKHEGVSLIYDAPHEETEPIWQLGVPLQVASLVKTNNPALGVGNDLAQSGRTAASNLMWLTHIVFICVEVCVLVVGLVNVQMCPHVPVVQFPCFFTLWLLFVHISLVTELAFGRLIPSVFQPLWLHATTAYAVLCLLIALLSSAMIEESHDALLSKFTHDAFLGFAESYPHTPDLRLTGFSSFIAATAFTVPITIIRFLNLGADAVKKIPQFVDVPDDFLEVYGHTGATFRSVISFFVALCVGCKTSCGSKVSFIQMWRGLNPRSNKKAFLATLIYFVWNIVLLLGGLRLRSWIIPPYAALAIALVVVVMPKTRWWAILVLLPTALFLICVADTYDEVNDEVWLAALSFLAPNAGPLRAALASTAAQLGSDNVNGTTDGTAWLIGVAVEHDGRLMLAGRRCALLFVRFGLALCAAIVMGYAHFWLAFGSVEICSDHPCGHDKTTAAEDDVSDIIAYLKSGVNSSRRGKKGKGKVQGNAIVPDSGGASPGGHRRHRSGGSGGSGAIDGSRIPVLNSHRTGGAASRGAGAASGGGAMPQPPGTLFEAVRRHIGKNTLRIMIVIVVCYCDVALFASLATRESFWLITQLWVLLAVVSFAALLAVVSVYVYTKGKRSTASKILPVISWAIALRFFLIGTRTSGAATGGIGLAAIIAMLQSIVSCLLYGNFAVAWDTLGVTAAEHHARVNDTTNKSKKATATKESARDRAKNKQPADYSVGGLRAKQQKAMDGARAKTLEALSFFERLSANAQKKTPRAMLFTGLLLAVLTAVSAALTGSKWLLFISVEVYLLYALVLVLTAPFLREANWIVWPLAITGYGVATFILVVTLTSATTALARGITGVPKLGEVVHLVFGPLDDGGELGGNVVSMWESWAVYHALDFAKKVLLL